MYRIWKEFSFEAAHRLAGLPAGHKCSRVHGHSYTVMVELTSEQLDSYGFVADFAKLAPLGDHIHAEMDHRDLNEVLAFQPSCERIAHHLYAWCRENLPAHVSALVTAVRVSETSTTCAEFRPSQHSPLGPAL
jgi:6-pyruvoyltetrahydropterin/6-carboxytetrahydropterin synthase